MGSSAENSSGVHWYRRRVRFNEDFGKGSEKGSEENLGGFGAEPGQVQQRFQKNLVGFNITRLGSIGFVIILYIEIQLRYF